MKVTYRGHEINVRRERCMAGYYLTYYSIIRDSDQFIVEDSFTEGEDTLPDMVRYLKAHVDDAIENPKDYE